MLRCRLAIGFGRGLCVERSVKDSEGNNSEDKPDQDPKEGEADRLLIEVVHGLKDIVVRAEEREHHGKGKTSIYTQQRNQRLL